MLISILMFIFSKFLSFIFFGQIWSQNLKFSKLTEIWYRGTLLYAYYDFNVYFSKIFVTHLFWANLSHNLDFFKLTKNFVEGNIAIYLLQFYCLFFQSSLHSSFLGKFGPKTWSSSNCLKFDTELDCYMLIS